MTDEQLLQVIEQVAQQQSTELDLSGHHLTVLPPEIGKLTHLKKLILGKYKRDKHGYIIDTIGNNLNVLPAEIGQLVHLEELNLTDNQLSSLPPEIVQLTNLQSLYLSDNQLSSLPPEIIQLTNLQSLDLSRNQLSSLPPEIGQLTLTHLYLMNNPIEKPPPEVVEKGIEAIRDYFRQLKTEGTDYLYEAKLLMVGEGGAGKTTLAKKIKNQNYQLQEEDSTKGIEVIPWSFPMDNMRDFKVNIWDFGGQEIYHATHQFFLTKRSLYALVADNRREDANFFYWLNVVELLSGNSPVLIIKNEKKDRPREINEPQLRGRFRNLKEILATNFANNRGLNEVLREIKHCITSLPHIGTELPRTWVRVRKALENDQRNYIGLDEYLEICQQNGFTIHKDKLQLSNYLHDLGVCLHFQDDPILHSTVILKPKWGTDAVYKVLDNQQVIDKLGKFTWNDLQNIWREEQYTGKQGELLQLMINFKLCYKRVST